MSKKQAKSFDVIVIGAGPAGYSSAIRCAQLGLKTACIDNWHDEEGQSSLGGTYLNAGCVASIALLESAKIYQSINHSLKEHGIQAEAVSVDIALMMQRKTILLTHSADKSPTRSPITKSTAFRRRPSCSTSGGWKSRRPIIPLYR
jgi:dihydrolipoamide dehydrogenase (EC 1.8.1.4)